MALGGMKVALRLPSPGLLRSECGEKETALPCSLSPALVFLSLFSSVPCAAVGLRAAGQPPSPLSHGPAVALPAQVGRGRAGGLSGAVSAVPCAVPCGTGWAAGAVRGAGVWVTVPRCCIDPRLRTAMLKQGAPLLGNVLVQSALPLSGKG